MRIALIADSHLSSRSPECVANWHAAARAVQRLAPDLTVHLGDITLDGQTHPDELTFAADLVRRWPTPMRCVPGNHDMGDGSGEAPLDEGLLSACQQAFGADRWCVSVPGWQLIGINAQLLGTNTPQEDAQWQWLHVLAESVAPDTRTALVLHRPLARVRPDDPKDRGRYVPQAARTRLLEGPLKRTLRLVVSGHTHQYLDVLDADVRHVWMPSSGFVLPDAMQPRIGEKLVGIGLLALGPGEMDFDLWCPDGMVRHDLSALPVFLSLGAAQSTHHASIRPGR